MNDLKQLLIFSGPQPEKCADPDRGRVIARYDYPLSKWATILASADEGTYFRVFGDFEEMKDACFMQGDIDELKQVLTAYFQWEIEREINGIVGSRSLGERIRMLEFEMREKDSELER